MMRLSMAIPHHISNYSPIIHKSRKEAFNTLMVIYPIWKIRRIHINNVVNLVDAQGRNPKCLI
jgi:hypothetical protein